MDIVIEAQRVLDIEAQAILAAKKRLNGDFARAVDLLMSCQGKIVVSGIGKSGHIARKIASTLSSTGSPAVFLHPAESSHGDLGIIGPKDALIVISYGGDTPEINDLLKYASRKGLSVVALTGRMTSELARAAQVTLDASVDEEACPLGLAPTSSSTVSLALGDALAVTLLKLKGFRAEDFAEFHPGGMLGRRLLTRVADLMHTGEALPLVKSDLPLRDVIGTMTRKEVRGVAGVIDEENHLIGIITDGDIRRRLEKTQAPWEDVARDLMSTRPKTIDQQELAEKALFIMEQFQIQTLFVVSRATDQPDKPVGLIHLQDLLKAKIR